MPITDAEEAIFGSFDGMTSTLGVVAGLLVTGASASRILVASIGIAVAATIGMGAGQFLSNRVLRGALVMALATLCGTVLPALPFVFGRSTAVIAASISITLLAGALIGHYRGYRLTFAILAVVSALTIALSLAVA